MNPPFGEKFRFFGGATQADLAVPLVSAAEVARVLNIPPALATALLVAESIPGVAVGNRKYMASRVILESRIKGELVVRLKVEKTNVRS